MKVKNKIVLYVLLGVSILHLTFTLIFSLDFLKLPQIMRVPAYYYSVPFFYQSWSMFAPSVPTYHQELQYRGFSQEKWTTWMDVTEQYESEAHSAMEYVEQNICSGLSQQVAGNFYQKNGAIQWDAITSSLEYQRAIFYAEKMHSTHGGLRLDSLQIRMMYRFIPSPGDTSRMKPTYLEFPCIDVSKQ